MPPKNPSPKQHLTSSQKLELVNLYESNLHNMSALAEIYKIHVRTVRSIISSHKALDVRTPLTSIASASWPRGVMQNPTGDVKKYVWHTSTCRGVYELYTPMLPIVNHRVSKIASVQKKVVTSFKRFRNKREFATEEDEKEFKERRRVYQHFYRARQTAEALVLDARLNELETIVASR